LLDFNASCKADVKLKRKATRKVNFTKRTIEALCANGDRRAIVYDSATRGLGVVCQPGSGAKSFFWFRRIAGGGGRLVLVMISVWSRRATSARTGTAN